MSNPAREIDIKLAEKLTDRKYRRSFFWAQTASQIAKQLINLRKRRGMSQKDVADAIGTKQPAISRAERADYENWNLATLRNIADALDARLLVTIEPSEDILPEYNKAAADQAALPSPGSTSFPSQVIFWHDFLSSASGAQSIASVSAFSVGQTFLPVNIASSDCFYPFAYTPTPVAAIPVGRQTQVPSEQAESARLKLEIAELRQKLQSLHQQLSTTQQECKRANASATFYSDIFGQNVGVDLQQKYGGTLAGRRTYSPYQIGPAQ